MYILTETVRESIYILEIQGAYLNSHLAQAGYFQAPFLNTRHKDIEGLIHSIFVQTNQN